MADFDELDVAELFGVHGAALVRAASRQEQAPDQHEEGDLLRFLARDGHVHGARELGGSPDGRQRRCRLPNLTALVDHPRSPANNLALGGDL